MNTYTNTHFYDRKIQHNIKMHVEKQEIKNMGIELLKLTSSFNCVATQFLKQIVDSIGTNANYDNTNDLNVDDLLVLCYNKRQNKDFINELEIQLIDMSSGSCPQGRTHRLYQIIKAFE
jgi:hypothetical protein